MTQEDKQLLLKDLYARLLYGVKACARFNTGNRYTANVTAISADRDYIQIQQNDLHQYTSSSIEDIRTYLRPMSSMTKEEITAYNSLCQHEVDDMGNEWFADTIESFDWLNAHHFDYRGLIKKGLALEAPEGMYKTE